MVCDDPHHLQHLAMRAWNLSMLYAASGETAPNKKMAEDQQRERIPSVPTEGLTESSVATSLALCGDLAEVCYGLLECLASSERRLHAMVRSQAVVCRCSLRMAMQPCTPSEKREHSSRAARAITSAFQVHQRWVQTAGCSKKDQATETPEERALNDDLVAGTDRRFVRDKGEAGWRSNAWRT